MPELGPTKISTVKLHSGRIAGAANIRNAIIKGIYDQAFPRWKEKMRQWIARWVPRATGFLARSTATDLDKSDPRHLYVGSPVGYASHVNLMTGVHWGSSGLRTANPNPKEQYYDKMQPFAVNAHKQIVIQAIRSSGLNIALGMTATEVLDFLT